MNNASNPKLILFNKPFGVLCQFSGGSAGRLTLADFIAVPEYYPAGRLDKDSEGLLILTNNGKLQQQISHPRFKLPKVYLVQVDGDIDDHAVQRLVTGVILKDGPANAVQAHKVEAPMTLWSRDPPIRQRKHIPTSWLSITLLQGRNRQVRRMTAAVGFPTLRLIRVSIGSYHVWEIPPGEYHRQDVRGLSRGLNMTEKQRLNNLS